jgi:hypothetical protein
MAGLPSKRYAPSVSPQVSRAQGNEADGLLANALATLIKRSVRRRSPHSTAPNVSTAHFSTFSGSVRFIASSPLLLLAPLF